MLVHASCQSMGARQMPTARTPTVSTREMTVRRETIRRISARGATSSRAAELDAGTVTLSTEPSRARARLRRCLLDRPLGGDLRLLGAYAVDEAPGGPARAPAGADLSLGEDADHLLEVDRLTGRAQRALAHRTGIPLAQPEHPLERGVGNR